MGENVLINWYYASGRKCTHLCTLDEIQINTCNIKIIQQLFEKYNKKFHSNEAILHTGF